MTEANLWNSEKVDKKAIEFAAGWDNKSKPPYDDLLIPYQLQLDEVYSSELHRLGHLTQEQYEAIQSGLKTINKEYLAGKLSVEGYEDVHSLVESRLQELYGMDLVGNLHMGISRNDQVITLMRMLMKDRTIEVLNDLELFVSNIEKEIEKKEELVFVGYSHQRVGMPTTYGKLLESYKYGLTRDKESLESWLKQYDECPLGVAAGFGSPIDLDREELAKKLGFNKPTENSIDTVTTRWEAEARLADTIKIMMNHLGTIAQDLKINSMEGINIISLPEEYCGGSSIMPQKQNPDVLEAIKGKAVEIAGESFKLSSISQGNISGYNKDTQWTKYWIINVFQEFSGSLEIMSEIIKRIEVNEDRVKELLEKCGAYAAEEAVKEAIDQKRPYREVEKEKRD